MFGSADLLRSSLPTRITCRLQQLNWSKRKLLEYSSFKLSLDNGMKSDVIEQRTAKQLMEFAHLISLLIYASDFLLTISQL